jgi:hypothetical protein
VPVGIVSVCWGAFMVVVLCLPQVNPTTISDLNYSGVALGAVLAYALLSWFLSANKWYKVAVEIDLANFEHSLSPTHHDHPTTIHLSEDVDSPVHVDSRTGLRTNSSNPPVGIRSSQLVSADKRLSELQLLPRISIASVKTSIPYDETHAIDHHLYAGRNSLTDIVQVSESSSSSSSAESNGHLSYDTTTTMHARDGADFANEERSTVGGIRPAPSMGHIEI